MCFSATASFSASALIGFIGVKTIGSCKNANERYFGSIPILFAIQQFSEGLVWLSLSDSRFLSFQEVSTNTYLLFAWVVWPLLIPLSIYYLDTSETVKKVCKGLFILALASSLFSLYQIAIGLPVASINSFHIDYTLMATHRNWVVDLSQKIVYVVTTLMPLFLSNRKGMKVFAVANLLSLFIAFYFFNNALASIWCFFAALLSGLIYWILKVVPAAQKSKATI